MDGWRNRELISNICDQSEPRIARMTRIGRTPLMPLVTTGILCSPFASFAQFAAQILVAATQRCGPMSASGVIDAVDGKFFSAVILLLKRIRRTRFRIDERGQLLRLFVGQTAGIEVGH